MRATTGVFVGLTIGAVFQVGMVHADDALFPTAPTDTSECLASSTSAGIHRVNRVGQTRLVTLTKGVCADGNELVVRYRTPWSSATQ